MEMQKPQQPVPGNYYVNLTDHLIRVVCTLYSDGELVAVRLEYQDSNQLTVNLDEWDFLDLKPYIDWCVGDSGKDTELEG